MKNRDLNPNKMTSNAQSTNQMSNYKSNVDKLKSDVPKIN